MEATIIRSRSNNRIKELKKLMASPGYRREKKCFPVEGPRMFFEIPRDRILECFITPSFEERCREAIRDYPYTLVDDHVMQALSDTKTPQGVLALVRREDFSPDQLFADKEPWCFLMIENLQDPGNLGTILRTAEGAGVNGVVVDRKTVDPYNMKVIRSTMGAVFRVPLLVTENLTAMCQRMKAAGVRVYAGHLEGEPLYRADFHGSCAFLIGNEGKGLSPEIMREADRTVRIPMKGRLESLNAAVASTVLMYEVLRQREWM